MLITTNEPQKVKDLFPNFIRMPMHFDFMLYTNIGTVGIERKAVPNDLISSIDDGRLGKEIIAMREECDFRVVIFHGVMRFDTSGQLKLTTTKRSRWTRTGLRNLRRTIEWVEGCFVEQVATDLDLVESIESLQVYLDEGKHLSLKGRPGIQKDWLLPTRTERVLHFYDGLPGIAPVRAKNLALAFPNPIDIFGASVEDLSKVSGIGKSTASDIYNFLRGIDET